jgi:hypothetical protein
MTSPVARGPAPPDSLTATRGNAVGPGEAGRHPVALRLPGESRPPADLFSRLLRRGRACDDQRAPEAASGAQAAELGAASMMANWFRSESSGPAAADGRRAVAGVVAPGAAPRVLIGSNNDTPEARIQINAGPCAGAEIRLRTGAAGIIEAELLTPTVSSRQTLAVAMDEVGLRLRAKGIHLRGAADSEGQRNRRQKNSERDNRQDDDGGGWG